MSQRQQTVLSAMSVAYFDLLTSLPWDRPLVVLGLREGLNKFLSNAYLSSFPAKRKFELTQLISPEAKRRIAKGRKQGLVFEHVVPKRTVIQEPCERRARDGTLTPRYIRGLLGRYWVLATVTEEEDRRLARRTMPKSWEGHDLFARYSAAGVRLVANPYAALGVPAWPVSRGRTGRRIRLR